MAGRGGHKPRQQRRGQLSARGVSWRPGRRDALQHLMPGNNRLLKEYREARSAKPDPEISLDLTDETDIFQWTALLKGPQGTPYEGGTFELSLKCTSSYPLAPPKATFVTPVFHP